MGEQVENPVEDTATDKFPGFGTGTTPTPNDLFDKLLTELTWDELKVALYIIRRTKGFNKAMDAISLSQYTDGIVTKDGKVLDKGCGIKNRTRVCQVLRSLEDGQYILVQRSETKTGPIFYGIHSVPSASDATVPSASDATVPSASDATVPSASDATGTHNKQLPTNSTTTNSTTTNNVAASANNADSKPSQEFLIDPPTPQPEQNQASGKTIGQSSTRENGSQKPVKPSKEKPPQSEVELLEPDMTGTWIAEKVVRYAEWCNKKRYRETERKRQIEAARDIHRDDPDITLLQFKQAYDERNDDWWQTNQGKLHVTHMKSKEKSSGVDRLHSMLDRLATKRPSQATQKPTNSSGKPGQKPALSPLGRPYRTAEDDQKRFEESRNTLPTEGPMTQQEASTWMANLDQMIAARGNAAATMKG